MSALRGLWPVNRPFGLPDGSSGDPGLFGPGSAIWQVGRERALLAAGPAALLLQIAHPLVAAGVSQHSQFQKDPFERLWSTLDIVMSVSFGDRRHAHAAAARVESGHVRIRGTLPSAAGHFAAGTPYQASDPELALWVHATLVWTALAAYARFVRPLRREERERYYQEMKGFGTLFGVAPRLLPPTHVAFEAYFRQMVQGRTLAVEDEAARLAKDILNPPLPTPLEPAAAVMKVITAGLLPARFRKEYGLRWGWIDRAGFEMLSVAVRTTLPLIPPALRYWPHYRAARRRVRNKV